jgi:DNA-binding transcriptional regulator YiaG
METTVKQKLFKTYKRNESLNNHNANGKLLVDNFGTDEEKEIMNAICARSKKLGYTLHEDIRVRYEISQKYYALIAK